MASVGQVVQIIITGNSDEAIASVEKFATATEVSTAKSTSAFAEFGKAATLGLVAAGGAIAAFGIKQAMEQETATAKLKTAINNTGAAYSDYTDKIEKASHAAINLGFDDADLTNSLARLVSATHNTGTALHDMSLAEDIARARHMDLQSATDLLAKVETGHVALLGRLGIATKDAEGKTISQTEAIKKLTDMYGGQAQAYTQTFAGKIEVLKAQVGELAEKVGFVLIPIIEKMVGAISDTFTWLEKNKAAAIALAVVIGGPLVASMVAFIGTEIGAAVAAIVGSFGELIIFAHQAADAIAALTLAQVAAVAAPLALVAGVAALGYGLSKLFGITDGVDQAIKKADESGKAWANHQIALAQTLGTTADGLNSLKLRIVDVKGEMAALQARYDSGAITFDQFETQAHKLNAELETLQGGTKKFKDQLDLAKTAAAAQTTELEQLATGTKNFADLTDKAQQAVFKLQSTLLAASGGELGYQQSLLNVQDAQDNLNKVMADGTSTAEDVAKAQLALQQAQLASLGSAESLNKSQTDLYNEMKTGGQSAYDSQLQKLKDLEGQYPANAAQIQDQIDKLNLVWWIVTHSPDSKTITVDAYTDPATIAINTLQQRVLDITAQTYIMTVDAYGLPP